jgi:hypothetical protein
MIAEKGLNIHNVKNSTLENIYIEGFQNGIVLDNTENISINYAYLYKNFPN